MDASNGVGRFGTACKAKLIEPLSAHEKFMRLTRGGMGKRREEDGSKGESAAEQELRSHL